VDAQVTSLGIAEQGTLNVSSVEAEDTLPTNAGVRETPEGVSQYDKLGALPILATLTVYLPYHRTLIIQLKLHVC